MMCSDGIHLISDVSMSELHRMACLMGIKRCWFHSGSRFPHYDIPKKMRDNFFENFKFVKKVTGREIVVILKRFKK